MTLRNSSRNCTLSEEDVVFHRGDVCTRSHVLISIYCYIIYCVSNFYFKGHIVGKLCVSKSMCTGLYQNKLDYLTPPSFTASQTFKILFSASPGVMSLIFLRLSIQLASCKSRCNRVPLQFGFHMYSALLYTFILFWQILVFICFV